MKHLVFIRGEKTDLRQKTVDCLMSFLNPNINVVRAICVSMDDYGPIKDKADRKAAAGSFKNMVRRLIHGHAEKFILIDNPNEKPIHWTSLYDIAEELRVPIKGIGVAVCKNEHPDIEGEKNKSDANDALFISSMAKYVEVENEQDLETLIEIFTELTPN